MPTEFKSYSVSGKVSERYGNGPSKIKLSCVKICDVGNLYTQDLIYYYEPSEIMELILRKMVASKYVFYMNNVIFDPFHNIGMMHYQNETMFFRFTDIVNDTELTFHVATMDPGSASSSIHTQKYVRQRRSYWYWSEPSCPGQRNTINIDRQYLSMYGSLPKSIRPMVEVFARRYLSVLKDEKELKVGAPIGTDRVRVGDDEKYW